jgi:hypothetical protein
VIPQGHPVQAHVVVTAVGIDYIVARFKRSTQPSLLASRRGVDCAPVEGPVVAKRFGSEQIARLVWLAVKEQLTDVRVEIVTVEIARHAILVGVHAAVRGKIRVVHVLTRRDLWGCGLRGVQLWREVAGCGEQENGGGTKRMRRLLGNSDVLQTVALTPTVRTGEVLRPFGEGDSFWGLGWIERVVVTIRQG